MPPCLLRPGETAPARNPIIMPYWRSVNFIVGLWQMLTKKFLSFVWISKNPTRRTTLRLSSSVISDSIVG